MIYKPSLSLSRPTSSSPSQRIFVVHSSPVPLRTTTTTSYPSSSILRSWLCQSGICLEARSHPSKVGWCDCFVFSVVFQDPASLGRGDSSTATPRRDLSIDTYTQPASRRSEELKVEYLDFGSLGSGLEVGICLKTFFGVHLPVFFKVE